MKVKHHRFYLISYNYSAATFISLALVIEDNSAITSEERAIGLVK